MDQFEQYPGLTFVEDEIGVDERRFTVVAPAIAQALHWAFEQQNHKGEEWTLESMDTIFSYGAQEGVAGPQLEQIYDYAIASEGGNE